MVSNFLCEQIEVRKREEKEAAEALRRDQELREAKRQQQRLNFLLTQTELYSHFMQNKSSGMPVAQASQDALRDLDKTVAPGEGLVATSPEDDEEEAALKEEAVRAATLAAAQQRNRTNDFDSESERLRTAAGGDEAGGAEDMDLLHP